MTRKTFSRIKKCISNLSISKKVLFSTLSVTVLPIIIILLICTMLVGSLAVKNITDTNETFLKGYSLLLEEQVETFEQLTQNILYEDIMKDYISGRVTEKDEIRKMLKSYMYRMSSIESIIFADASGNVYYAEEKTLNRSLVYQDVLKIAEKKDGSPFFCTEDSVYSNRIYLSRNVYDTNGLKAGTVIFMLNTNFFADIDKNLYMPYEHSLIISDDDGVIYTNMDVNSFKGSIAKQKKSDWKNSYFSIDVPDRNWEVYTVVPKIIMYMTFIKWYVVSLIFALLVVCVIYFVTGKVVGFVLMPMNTIISVINENKGGKKTYFEYEYNDEYKQMAVNFNSMIDELERKSERQVQLVTLMKNAQIGELQAQITPHFLFNCLNIINWAAIKNNNMDISKMVLSLSHILTVNAGKIDALVSISRELEYFEDYISILKMRFGDNIHLTFNCDKEAHDCLIIPLMLQTMVENSWIHGMRHDRVINIDVSIVKLENELVINVYDDGKGIAFQKLKQLRYELNFSESPEHFSGIINLNRRIKLLYGEKYGMEISSAENEYTSIEVILPTDVDYENK